MTDDAAVDLRMELETLRQARGLEYTRRLWQLAEQGQDIVSDLQQIGRHGPGRHRAAALEVLVNIVGEAGLHPADLAAAERLVRIKAPLEPFLNVSLCWDVWLCVRGSDQQAIIESLGLTPVRAATFALAASVVSEKFDDANGLVFVTPQLNGWIVVAGGWCSPSDEDGRCEEVRSLVERLSSEFSEAHAFSISEYSDCSTWLIARHGITIRRYSEDSPAMAIGCRSKRRHLDALGISGSPEEARDDKELDEAFSKFPWVCNARTVAAEVSIDIVSGIWRRDSTVQGTGVLARIPGSSALSISPGAYKI